MKAQKHETTCAKQTEIVRSFRSCSVYLHKSRRNPSESLSSRATGVESPRRRRQDKWLPRSHGTRATLPRIAEVPHRRVAEAGCGEPDVMARCAVGCIWYAACCTRRAHTRATISARAHTGGPAAVAHLCIENQSSNASRYLEPLRIFESLSSRITLSTFVNLAVLNARVCPPLSCQANDSDRRPQQWQPCVVVNRLPHPPPVRTPCARTQRPVPVRHPFRSVH